MVMNDISTSSTLLYRLADYIGHFKTYKYPPLSLIIEAHLHCSLNTKMVRAMVPWGALESLTPSSMGDGRAVLWAGSKMGITTDYAGGAASPETMLGIFHVFGARMGQNRK